MPHTEAAAIQSAIARIGAEAPLLRENDKFQDICFLLVLAVGEVEEFQEELNEPDSEREHHKLINEYWDVWVFVVSWIHSFKPDYNVDSQLLYTNGMGKKSTALDKLKQTIPEIASDETALREVLRLLYSLGKYLPHPLPTIYSLHALIDDVLKRRDPNYYNLIDPYTGKTLADDDVPVRFKYLETCMRLIRNWVKKHEGRTEITPADKAPYHEILLDFRGGDANIDRLKEMLEQKTSFREDPSRGLIVPSHMITES